MYVIRMSVVYFILHVSLFWQILNTNSAYATNGPQLIGFSAESTALAGAGHISIADTSAINTNPAALSLIQGIRFDFTAGVVQAFLSHSDAFGNSNFSGQNNLYAFGNLGFASRINAVPGLSIGAGIFSQGGFGSGYRNLQTMFGTRDDTSSFFRYVKFAIALSYDITNKLSVGFAPSIGYADASLSLFPGTSALPSSSLPEGFSGISISDKCSKAGGLGVPSDCPSDIVFGIKVGMMYRVSNLLSIGASYTSPVDFNFTNGQATFNLTEFGLGKAHYDNARLSGIKWPQQVDVSVALKPMERVTFSVTGSWINWETINDVRIAVSETNNSLAPSQTSMEIPFNWKDQVAVGLGLSYTAIKEESWKTKDRFILRVGYNYGSNPAPKETMTPIAPVILKHHLTGGFGFRFTEKWSYDLGALYAMKNSVTYTNASLPLGLNASESVSVYYIYNTISYNF